MARKTRESTKQSKKKNNKNRAAKKAAPQKPPLKTSTIRVRVDAITDPKENKKTNTKKKPKSKKNHKIKAKVKPRENKKRNLKKVFKWIGVILLIIAAAIFLFTTPLFNVTEIEVVGNEAVSNEEIISLSQIKLNENMFKNIKSKIKENVKGNAYIENVKVKRVLPDKMQIIVQERQVKFMVKLLNSYAYISSQGYILEITEQTKEVPVIEGVSTPEEEVIVGRRLNIEDLKKLETVLKIVSSCEENEISRYITSINIQNSNEYTMYMAEKGKTVHLGDPSNLDTKILYVKVILQSEEENEGDIFVNGDLNNGFQPFFREKV